MTRTVDVIGNRAVNFHAPVHRAGMHDNRVGLGIGQLFPRPTRSGGNTRALTARSPPHPSARVARLQLIITTSAPSSPAFMFVRTPRRQIPRPLLASGCRGRQGARGFPSCPARSEIRTRDPAMGNVAADCHGQPVQPAPLAAGEWSAHPVSACVGCSWLAVPRPAFSTAQFTFCASRSTCAGIAMAHHQKVRVQWRSASAAVSISVSALFSGWIAPWTYSSQSAPRRFARQFKAGLCAGSNSRRNMLIWVMPSSAPANAFRRCGSARQLVPAPRSRIKVRNSRPGVDVPMPRRVILGKCSDGHSAQMRTAAHG